ncbi:MAG: DMT family transporter [Anaerolineales bacterium]|nr:DMT family transporter [Anaerolineales bacterium]
MKNWLLPTILALFAWVFWGFFPKLAARHIGPQSAMIYQVLGGILIGLAVLINLKFKVEFNLPGFSYGLAIGLLGFFGALMYLVALSRGPLALVAPITAMYPVGAILLGLIFLGEPITIKQGMGIALSLVAIYLISS